MAAAGYDTVMDRPWTVGARRGSAVAVALGIATALACGKGDAPGEPAPSPGPTATAPSAEPRDAAPSSPTIDAAPSDEAAPGPAGGDVATARLASAGPPAVVELTRLGGLSSDDGAAGAIHAAILARRKDVKACYLRREATRPGLAGKVTAKLSVGADGRVTEASATGMDAEVARCIADVLRTVTFPPPEGGQATITFPFVFSKQ